MNKCEKCGFLHYRTDPCRKPKKSTGLDPKPSEEGIKVTVAQEDALTSAPVDANSVSAKSEETMLPASQVTVFTTSAGTVGNKDRQTISGERLLKDISGFGLASPAKVSDARAANTKDANSFAESPNGRAADFESAGAGSTPASAPKFDKKAWMREYMREHRRGIRRRVAK